MKEREGPVTSVLKPAPNCCGSLAGGSPGKSRRLQSAPLILTQWACCLALFNPQTPGTLPQSECQREASRCI